jgi:hypothetical protein
MGRFAASGAPGHVALPTNADWRQLAKANDFVLI